MIFFDCSVPPLPLNYVYSIRGRKNEEKTSDSGHVEVNGGGKKELQDNPGS